MKKLYLLMIAICPLAISGMDRKKSINSLVQLQKEPVWQMPIGQSPEMACWAELQKYDVASAVPAQFMLQNNAIMGLHLDGKQDASFLDNGLHRLKQLNADKYQELVCATVYCAKALAFMNERQLPISAFDASKCEVFRWCITQLRESDQATEIDE